MGTSFKKEIEKLARSTLLTNKEIAKIVGCSLRAVNRYAGAYDKRIKEKIREENPDIFNIKKAVLLPDIHHPHYDHKLMESVNDFIKDYDPDEIVYMGDQMALDSISTWTKHTPLLREGQRLIRDYHDFDRDILKVHEKITRKETKRVFMIGNHEQRVNWYCEEHPSLSGLINIEYNLKLKERGYKVIPYNNIYKIGKLNVIHGFYYNKYHSAKTVDVFEGNVVYGHVHSPQVFTKVSPIDTKGYHMATALPCLCNIKPDYKQNLPNI